MAKLLMIFSGVLLFLTGCLHTSYHGESFPATNVAIVVDRNNQIPAQYQAIGQACVWGEASGTSDGELKSRMITLGESHGAEYIRLLGYTFTPSAPVASDEVFNELEGLDFDQEETQDAMYEDDAPNATFKAQKTWTRRLYAEFFRRTKNN